MLNFRLHYLSFILALLVTTASLAFGSFAVAETNSSAPGFLNTNDSGALVGSLPSSNQWLYDRPSSFIYLGFDNLVLKSPSLQIDHFTSNLGSPHFNFFSLASFMRLFSLAPPENNSIFGQFSFWGQFSVGLGSRDGSLYDNSMGTALPAESSNVLALFGSVGVQFVYDYLNFFKPYVGMSTTWYGYRHSSSMSGAVSQGGGDYYGPTLGAHIPLTFLGRFSIFGEVQKILTTPGDGQIFAESTNFNGGLGFTF
jgi:hypothetical protein